MVDRVVELLSRLYERVRRGFINLYHFFEINEATGMLGLGIFVGVACGHAAVGLRHLLALIQTFVFGGPESSSFLEVLRSIPWYYRLTAPAAGGLLVGPMVHYLSRELRGTGVPEVLSAVVTREGRIRWRVIPLKTVASCLTIGTGGSAGREGPIVHIGAGLGSAVGEFLELAQKKVKTLLGCGAAAGIAGTFNAPLGGVIFSLEILLEDFHVSQFTAIVV
jgi:CIC family chloride channel protein